MGSSALGGFGGLFGGGGGASLSTGALGGLYADDQARKAKHAVTDVEKEQKRAEARARNDAAASYNAEAIATRRRRKAGSVLSRTGAGVPDSVGSVLAAAGTYGKEKLGA